MVIGDLSLILFACRYGAPPSVFIPKHSTLRIKSLLLLLFCLLSKIKIPVFEAGAGWLNYLKLVSVTSTKQLVLTQPKPYRSIKAWFFLSVSSVSVQSRRSERSLPALREQPRVPRKAGGCSSWPGLDLYSAPIGYERTIQPQTLTFILCWEPHFAALDVSVTSKCQKCPSQRGVAGYRVGTFTYPDPGLASAQLLLTFLVERADINFSIRGVFLSFPWL